MGRLCLSRLVGQEIVIGAGGQIRITIAKVGHTKGGRHKVRIDIEAPREVPVHRLEVHNAIQQGLAATERGCGAREGGSP